MYKRVRVCTQVTVQPIAVNTAALGSTMLLPQDSELVEKGEDVDSAARGSTILSARDYALLDETKGGDLKWKPCINKSTKKKAAKQNVQKNPTTNPKQAARAHKNNLLLYQITSYAASY